MNGHVITGDCREILPTLAEASVDAIVTDPPYELTSARPGGRSEATRGKVMGGFMGMKWDGTGVAFDPAMWAEALRVLKPGGHLLAFSGSRTYHRMVCAIEDAGFEIRDQIMWIYGGGFPKSLDVSKAIDREAGAERPVVGKAPWSQPAKSGHHAGMLDPGVREEGRFTPDVTAPATDAARQWQGWGTALKPAHEPIVVARKPLIGTVAANVLAHGTGAINVGGCRVNGAKQWPTSRSYAAGKLAGTLGTGGFSLQETENDRAGRWPANVIHDGSDEVVRLFPAEAGAAAPVFKRGGDKFRNAYGAFGGDVDEAGSTFHGDSGSAARFFYCAKASGEDRNEGCDGLPERTGGMVSNTSGQHITRRDGGAPGPRANHHPTVKPTSLMRYLVRLVAPPGGKVLDPFAGSGSTGKACELEGFDYVLIEGDAQYVPIIEARTAAARAQRHVDTAQMEFAI